MKEFKDPVVVFLTLLLIVIFASMIGCSTKPPDFPICVEMSMERGECIKVISGEKIRVDNDHKMNGKTWWESRPTNMIMPLESWVELKKFIIKLCKKNQGMCDKEVSTWQRSIQTVDENLESKGITVPKVPMPEPSTGFQEPDNYYNP